MKFRTKLIGSVIVALLIACFTIIVQTNRSNGRFKAQYLEPIKWKIYELLGISIDGVVDTEVSEAETRRSLEEYFRRSTTLPATLPTTLPEGIVDSEVSEAETRRTLEEYFNRSTSRPAQVPTTQPNRE